MFWSLVPFASAILGSICLSHSHWKSLTALPYLWRGHVETSHCEVLRIPHEHWRCNPKPKRILPSQGAEKGCCHAVFWTLPGLAMCRSYRVYSLDWFPLLVCANRSEVVRSFCKIINKRRAHLQAGFDPKIGSAKRTNTDDGFSH